MEDGFPSGDQVDRYEIEEIVKDQDGVALYRCRDAVLEREVAVKTVSPGDSEAPDVADRLWTEARARASVEHGHVLPLHFVRSTESGPLLVGPWLTGGPLSARADEGRLTIPLLLRTVAGVGRALDALHAAGWVHCDLKPGNIVLAPDGRPVLIDLASARQRGEPLVRQGGSGELTPHFVPPEACRGEPLSTRSDVYSLGVLLYLGLAGRYPVKIPDGVEDPEVIHDLQRGTRITPPSRHTTILGPRVDAVVMRSLRADPDARYGSAGEVGEALREALEAEGLLDAPDPAVPGADAAEESDGGGGDRAVPMIDQLEEFEESLTERERAALRVILARARRVREQARGKFAFLSAEQFGVPASLLALEEVGAAAALAEGATTPAEVAESCGVPEERVARVLDVLGGTEFVLREDGGYSLPATLEVFYQDARRLGVTARPVARAAEFWNHLPHWLATGEPRLEMDAKDGDRYARSVNSMGGHFAEPAGVLVSELQRRELLCEEPAILDVGAGSGVWSLAFAAEEPGARITAVDRPAVLAVARENAASAGVADRMTDLPGDWRDVELEPESFDLCLIANLCHLESGEAVRELFERVLPALRPEGLLMVVDTIPEVLGEAPLALRLQTLRLALRSTDGGLHDLRGYRRWLEAAGFQYLERIRLQEDPAGVSAVVARRREASRRRRPAAG